MTKFLVLAFCVVFIGCAQMMGTSGGHKPLSATERARLLVEVANGSLVEGDSTGALQSLAQAESYDPKLPELHHTRALAYYAKKDLKRAIEEAKKAVDLYPTYSEANNTLGKIYLDLGRYNEAEPPLIQASHDTLYRDAYKAYTNLGILYYRKENYKKSEESLNHAVTEFQKGACVAYYYLGHISLIENKYGDAEKNYSLATKKFCAGFAEAHLALGLIYEKNKEYEKARKKFIEIKRNFSDTKYADQAMDQLKYIP